MGHKKSLLVVSIGVGIAILGWGFRGCSNVGMDVESLLGVDSNHDGVRDDVEKFIEQNYSDDKIKIVCRELHKGIQEAMLDSSSDAKRTLFALDCLYYLNPEIAGKVSDEIEAVTLNTQARIESSWKGDAAHSGTILPSARSKQEACGFDVRLLELK